VSAVGVWAAIGAVWTTVALLIGLAVGRTARLREDRDDHDDLHDAEALAVARDAELVDTANRSPDPVHHVLFGLAWPEGRDR
jgi:hypothetical protein